MIRELVEREKERIRKQVEQEQKKAPPPLPKAPAKPVPGKPALAPPPIPPQPEEKVTERDRPATSPKPSPPTLTPAKAPGKPTLQDLVEREERKLREARKPNVPPKPQPTMRRKRTSLEASLLDRASGITSPCCPECGIGLPEGGSRIASLSGHLKDGHGMPAADAVLAAVEWAEAKVAEASGRQSEGNR